LRAKALDGPSDPFEHTRERFLFISRPLQRRVSWL
jgi:hypothetical protein